MSSGTVRELVTKVTFKVDNSSVGRVNQSINNLKRNLEQLSRGVDTSLNQSLSNVSRSIRRVSSSIARLNSQMSRLGRINNTNNTDGGNPLGNLRINSLRVTSASTRVSGGNVTVHGFNPSSNGNPSTNGLLNAIRNIRVMHADRVFVKGNISGNNHGNGRNNPPNPPPNPHGNPSGGRLQNFVDQSGNMIAAGAAMIAPVVFPVREAMKFESAMADVKKVVDFDGAKESNNMSKAIQDMSMKIPMAQEELANIVAAGGQSGIEKQNLMEFAESAAEMGVAFDIPADKAGDMMAQWRTAFKMGQAEVVDLADKVNFLQFHLLQNL